MRGGGHAWQVGGHVWQGEGACVAGGVCGKVACMACMPPLLDTMATAYGQ